MSVILSNKLAAKAAGKPIMPHSPRAHKINLLAVAYANSMANGMKKTEQKQAISLESQPSAEIIEPMLEIQTSAAAANEQPENFKSRGPFRKVKKSRRGRRCNKKKISYYRYY